MSDSASFNQQRSVSRVQAPSTSVRSASSDVPPLAQSVVVEQIVPSITPAVSLPSAPEPSLTNSASVTSQNLPLSQSIPLPQLSSVPSPAPMPSPPSSSPHKESAPIPTVVPSVESPKPVEVVQPSTPEISVPPEVKEVVAISEEAKPPAIDIQMQKAGVAVAAESTPVAHTPTGDVRLPMTYADALATEKRTSFMSAVHWFAAFIAYQWRKLDPSLKD